MSHSWKGVWTTGHVNNGLRGRRAVCRKSGCLGRGWEHPAAAAGQEPGPGTLGSPPALDEALPLGSNVRGTHLAGPESRSRCKSAETQTGLLAVSLRRVLGRRGLRGSGHPPPPCP